MKIYVKKYFKFLNFKNLFCLFCLITFISCASNTKLDELQNPEILEQSEQENLNSDDEKQQNDLEKSEENENLQNQNYPEIEILKDEPNVFDEPIQNQTESENIQEIDSDINPYFESEPENLTNSTETEILTENEELPKDISEFYSQENDSQSSENQNEQTESSAQEIQENLENQENPQILTDENQETQEISENLTDENQENSQTEENNLNQNLTDRIQEVPTVEEINSLDETNFAQENLDAENNFSTEQNEIPVASRTMTMKQNQYLEVHYPGSGWIYLGEEDSKSLMRYMGRKIGTSDTIFTLRSRSQGTTLLHFYKNDALTGNFIDDYLEVQIKGKATDSQTAIAPSYEEIVPKRFNSVSSDLTTSSSDSTTNSSSQSADSFSENANSSTSATTSQNQATNSFATSENSSSQETSNQNSANSPEEILKLAQDSYDAKNFSQSLNYINEFLTLSNTKLDEALFLKGQILEYASEVQNIKEALNAYESLVKSYPKSSYWKRASDRATYIKRFYFNIR